MSKGNSDLLHFKLTRGGDRFSLLLAITAETRSFSRRIDFLASYQIFGRTEMRPISVELTAISRGLGITTHGEATAFYFIGTWEKPEPGSADEHTKQPVRGFFDTETGKGEMQEIPWTEYEGLAELRTRKI